MLLNHVQISVDVTLTLALCLSIKCLCIETQAIGRFFAYTVAGLS